MVCLETRVGGIPLACCIYNASGPKSGHVTDLVAVGESRAGVVLSKSATLEKRSGNPLPRLKKLDMGTGRCAGSINSEGLPNSGIDYYIGPKVVPKVEATGKPYIVSLSGMSLADNLEMISRVCQAHAVNPKAIAGIELNLACPNIKNKPTVALDFEQMQDVLTQVCSHPSLVESKLPLGVKLAPYFDSPHFDQAAAIINAFATATSSTCRIAFVVTMNTIGNCMVVDIDAEQALIAPKGGFGGIAGGFAKPIALSNVAQLRSRLAQSIDIVGVGGVASGADAFELILCGATAVQTATTHWLEGPACFARIAGELEDIMRKKGYSSLADFKGNLKPYDKSRASPAVASPKPGKASKLQFDSLHMVLAAALLATLMGMVIASENGIDDLVSATHP